MQRMSCSRSMWRTGAGRKQFVVRGHQKMHPGGQKRPSNTSGEENDRKRKDASQDKIRDSKTEGSISKCFGVVRLQSAAEYDA